MPRRRLDSCMRTSWGAPEGRSCDSDTQPCRTVPRSTAARLLPEDLPAGLELAPEQLGARAGYLPTDKESPTSWPSKHIRLEERPAQGGGAVLGQRAAGILVV